MFSSIFGRGEQKPIVEAAEDEQAPEGTYDKRPVNAVKRYADRGNYDYAVVHSIVNTCPVLHVSFNPLTPTDNPFPTILPMLGCTGSFESPNASPSSSPQTIYLHGYVSSRLMRLPTNSDSHSTNESCTITGTPICIAATLLDGLVLALTPNHHSCNYRSAVVYGYATLVTDEKEKLYVMERITNNMLPNRWANSRIPPTKIEMQSTSILKVEVESASAKIRTGGPGEDKDDLADEELRGRVWTGVVPAYTAWSDPVPAEGNRVKKLPGYIETWRKGTNYRSKSTALAMAEEQKE